MNCCYVDKIKNEDQKIYFLRATEDMSIIKEPSKYLKHKTKQHCSPNTVRSIAYALSYYIDFIHERGIIVQQVLRMNYSEQYEHFIDFLSWVQKGNHCNRRKLPRNNTCNSYLQSVFGYYEFTSLEYDYDGGIKVLRNQDISYSGLAGVKFRRGIKMFRGYLPGEESVGRTIEDYKIDILLDASDNLRDKLLISLLTDTGLRIGEILGIKYAQDIDYEKRTIKVTFREDNDNEARAKNAEIRRTKINDKTFEILQLYISENRELLSKTGYLFVSMAGEKRGEALTVSAVYSIFRTLEKKTGIKATPHMFRHNYANERRKRGWEMIRISMALGHKKTETTEKYIHIEETEMLEACEMYYKEKSNLFDLEKIM